MSVRLLSAFPPAGRSPVAAAALAVPLTAVSRTAVLTAPLVAAVWARSVADTAEATGTAMRVEPIVTADLAGITAEVVRADETALRSLQSWFQNVPPPGETELERLRDDCVARLPTSERGSEDVRRALFGDRHRYGVTHRERAAHLRDADVRTVEDAMAELLAERPAAFARADDTARPPGRRTAVRVDGARACCLIGAPGVALASPRKFPLHVAWAALGGRDGLLDRRLRQERALTYSVAAFSRELAEGGYGMCVAACRPDALDEVSAVVRDTFAALAKDGVSGTALRSVKERLIVRQHRALQTARGRAERLLGYAAAGLPPADLDRYPRNIATVTSADVRSAAATTLTPETFLELKLIPTHP
ncbi:M16 family metallopeptidase [Actinomadura syzygii]|uniref:Insulinase family protein n=1 Tax=Actinomadura syzygii TaxID=1427538 RepID=A0A5D0UBM5_9ACTN|nr:insulinase family protein [Actinomadura syzygii]TYC15035.1 insulinase family protein [Actinomadura syzygii]